MSYLEVIYAWKFLHQDYLLNLMTSGFLLSFNEHSLKNVGIYLLSVVFSHDQLYVVISRVTSRDGLKMFITDEDDQDTNMTSNVVYREVFRNIG